MIKLVTLICSFTLALGSYANPQLELNTWLDSAFEAEQLNWDKIQNQFTTYTADYYKESPDALTFLRLFNTEKRFKGNKSFKNKQPLNYPVLYKLAAKTETLFPALENQLLTLIFKYDLAQNQNLYTYLWVYINHLNYLPLNDTRPNEMAYQLLILKSFMADDLQLFEKVAVMILSRKIMKENDFIASIDLVKKLYPTERVKYDKTSTPEHEEFDDQIVDTTSIEPAFIGGNKNMTDFIVLNVNYPEEAKMMGDQGIVFTKFVVTRDGSVTKVAIKKGVTNQLDQEAFRVIRIMPAWIPGSQLNKPVQVSYNLPIHFRLG